MAALEGLQVLSAVDGEASAVASLGPGVSLLVFLTHTGDLDSFELAQRLVDVLPALDAAGVTTKVVTIATPAAARLFCELTRFPAARLFCDENAACYAALKLPPGAGRPGGPLPAISSLPPVAKLMVMCAGLGSPGTLPEVFRGYFGDRTAKQLYSPSSNVTLGSVGPLFDTVGTGYQRPFELATHRLLNMTAIGGRWAELAPADGELLLQRGGVRVLRDGVVTWAHDDAGVLGYAKVEAILQAAGVPL